jgi:hypothetical protein
MYILTYKCSVATLIIWDLLVLAERFTRLAYVLLDVVKKVRVLQFSLRHAHWPEKPIVNTFYHQNENETKK